jgi:hypothetical protein
VLVRGGRKGGRKGREEGTKGKGWMEAYLLVASFEGLIVGGSLGQLAVGRTQKVDGVL